MQQLVTDLENNIVTGFLLVALASWPARAEIELFGGSALLDDEEPAGDIGIADLTGILVLQLDQATFGAAVAQGFPFRVGHLRQRLAAPERLLGQTVLHCPAYPRYG